jgi:hypothetical protein
MKQKALYIVIVLGTLLMGLSSCKKEDDSISRRYPCRFQFYAELHPTSLIVTACKSAGTYVYIYTKFDNRGIRHIYAQINNSRTPVEDILITTDKEKNYTSYLLGANNEIGLIVGLTNFNGLVAYDRTCANCAERQPLVWVTDTWSKVSCSKCKRVYDLETGALLSGSGDGMLRYGCNFNGQLLTVGN